VETVVVNPTISNARFAVPTAASAETGRGR